MVARRPLLWLAAGLLLTLVLLGGSFGKLDSTFFKNYPELRRIRAYENHNVFAITGNLMERPGPRIVESVRELKSLLQRAVPQPSVSAR